MCCSCVNDRWKQTCITSCILMAHKLYRKCKKIHGGNIFIIYSQATIHRENIVQEMSIVLYVWPCFWLSICYGTLLLLPASSWRQLTRPQGITFRNNPGTGHCISKQTGGRDGKCESIKEEGQLELMWAIVITNFICHCRMWRLHSLLTRCDGVFTRYCYAIVS